MEECDNFKLIYLGKEDEDPSSSSYWIMIEEDDDGAWYGTGFGEDPRSGLEKIYISDPINDRTFDSSLKAAKEWAAKRGVRIIYVRRMN